MSEVIFKKYKKILTLIAFKFEGIKEIDQKIIKYFKNFLKIFVFQKIVKNLTQSKM